MYITLPGGNCSGFLTLLIENMINAMNRKIKTNKPNIMNAAYVPNEETLINALKKIRTTARFEEPIQKLSPQY